MVYAKTHYLLFILLTIFLFMVCFMPELEVGDTKKLNPFEQKQQKNAAPKRLELLGKSYNIFTGNPVNSYDIDPGFKRDVFVLDWSNNKKTPDGLWLIPNQCSSVTQNYCSFDTITDKYAAQYGYQFVIKQKVETPLLTANSFSLNQQYVATQNILNTNNYVQFSNSASCYAYTLTLDVSIPLPLTEQFKIEVINAYNSGSWDQFILLFGTHYLVKVIAGGRMSIQQTMKQEDFQRLLGSDFNFDIGAKFSFYQLTGSGTKGNKDQEKAGNIFSYYLTSHDIFYIGGKPAKGSSTSSWQNSVKQNPESLNYDLLPLSNLITKKEFPDQDPQSLQNSMQNGFINYCMIRGCSVPFDRPLPPAAKTQSIKTKLYGPKTSGATVFEDAITTNPNMRICQVNFNCATVGVYGLQLVLCDGITEYYPGDYHGTHEGFGNYVWEIGETQEANEFVNKVIITFTKTDLQSIQFITNQGQKSDICGDNTRKPVSSYTIETEGPIVGLNGIFIEYINQIGFTSNKIIYPED